MLENGSYSVTHNVMCLKLLRTIVICFHQDQVCKPVQGDHFVACIATAKTGRYLNS